MERASISKVRQGELWSRLAEVNDPELDEPVTEMGFVERAEVAGDGSVTVDFRLPTYWCSPNFAFLMLGGIRQALDALSWAPAYRVTLRDHMFADEVNRGMAEGRSFSVIFGDLAGDLDLSELRETFRRKAFQRRQEAVLLGLRGKGVGDGEIVGMRMADFDAVRFEPGEADRQKPRYRAAYLDRHAGRARGQPVFVTYDGKPIEAAGLGAHLADLRGVRINMEFNGALCRGLKHSRYKEMGVVDGEPTLVDFIMKRGPAATAPFQNSS